MPSTLQVHESECSPAVVHLGQSYRDWIKARAYFGTRPSIFLPTTQRQRGLYLLANGAVAGSMRTQICLYAAGARARTSLHPYVVNIALCGTRARTS